jgi:hypothetical protein
MLDLLARGRVVAAGEQAGLTAREQDLRRRIAELTRELERAEGGEPGLRGAVGGAEAGTTREALARAGGVRRAADRAARGSRVRPARAGRSQRRDVRSALAPDEALLSTWSRTPRRSPA